MAEAIWGTWYDLPDGDPQAFAQWSRDEYLPFLLAQPRFRWVAHYRYVGGGAQMSQVKSTIVRHSDDALIGQGTQSLVLVGADRAHDFFDPAIDDLPLPEGFAQRLATRQGVRMAVFTLEASVDGPSRATQQDGAAPAPAIQMGTLRPTSLDGEFDLIKWYAQYRMPSMGRMPGAVRTRKWSGIAGWPKHGILYEFESLQHRLDHFEKPHESLALEPGHWTNRITRASVHAPGSPFIGERTWLGTK